MNSEKTSSINEQHARALQSTNKQCKNCGSQDIAQFCSHCGQAANTRVITLAGAFKNLISHISDLDNKLFYTLRQMLTSPGRASLKYVLGHRVKFIHPIKYFVVAMGLNFLAISELQAQGAIAASKLQLPEFINIPVQEQQAIAQWILKYAHLLMVTLLPIYGYFLSLFFGKKRTAGESSAFLFYLWGNLAIISMLFLFTAQLIQSNYVQHARSIAVLVYSGWAILQFFEAKFFYGLWRTAVSYLCYSLVALVIIVTIFKGYEIWLSLS